MNDDFIDGYILGDTIASLPVPKTRTWWGAVVFSAVQAFFVTVIFEGTAAILSSIIEHIFD